MITNRRLIETIRGRATAGDALEHVPLAARPRVVRAASRATLAVGGAGLACALAVSGGGLLLRPAASAAVAAGGYGSGRADTGPAAGADPEDAALVGQAASAAVTAALPGPTAAIPATLLALPVAADVTAPAAPVAAPAAVAATPSAPAAPAAPPDPAPRAPVAAPPAVAAPAAAPVAPDPGSVEAIIHEIFGEHGSAAVAVARCESGLNPQAVSRGGGNWGLFQINKVHRGRVQAMGYQWEDVLDARVNTLVARSIFDEQGWQPWGCRRAAH